MATNDSYYQQIAAMRQERHQRETTQRLNDIVNEHSELTAARDDALRDGDQENADFYDAECEKLEREFSRLNPPQPQQLSDAKLKWLAERWDLPRHPKIQELAAGAHAYVTQDLGIPDDSSAYFDAMAVYLEPPGYEKPVSPDEVCKALGIDAKTYNQNVNKLARLKQAGAYRDR